MARTVDAPALFEGVERIPLAVFEGVARMARRFVDDEEFSFSRGGESGDERGKGMARAVKESWGETKQLNKKND